MDYTPTDRRVRAFRQVLAVAVALVVVVGLSGPASAGGIVVVSEHSTESDFLNGTVGGGAEVVGDSVQMNSDVASESMSQLDTADTETVSDDAGIVITTNGTEVTDLTPGEGGNFDEFQLLDENENHIETISTTGTFSTTLQPNTKYIVAGVSTSGDYSRAKYTNPDWSDSEAITVNAGWRGCCGGGEPYHYNVDSLDYNFTKSTSGNYTSSVHDAENVDEGIVNLSRVDGSTVDITWEGRGSGDWTTVATATTTTTGEVRSNITDDYTEWRVTVDFTPDDLSGETTMTQDAVTADTSDPVLSNGSPDSETFNEPPVTLEIDVDDSDFTKSHSDQVTLEWFVNGNLVDTTTHTQAERASIQVGRSDLQGGQNEWHVEATDEYGHTDTSVTRTFTVPGDMQIFNESNPETLINDREITVEFFDLNGEEITSKTTSDGNVSMDGLQQTTFAVRLSDSQGDYADRQVIIRDIFEQKDVWMLNESNPGVSAVTPTFIIEDATGDFDPTNSRVFIQRGLNISGTTTYRTIAAEEVGTDGYTETLEANQRYRIVVENQDGDRRVLGKFSAADSNTYTLTVEELTFDLTADNSTYLWGFNHTDVEDGQDFVKFRYNDSENITSSLDIVIYERGNESNELHNQTYSGDIGVLSIKEFIPTAYENSEWVVEWSADRGDEQHTGSRIAGPLGSVPIPTSDRLVHTIAVGFILMVGGLASTVNAPAVGFSVAGTAGIAFYIGWLPPAVAGGMIALAFFVPVLYLVESDGGFG